MTPTQERTRRSLIGATARRTEEHPTPPHPTPPHPTQNPLLPVFAEAARAMPYTERARPGDMDPLRISKRAASARTLVLQSTPLPSIFDREGRTIREPAANMAGQTIMLGAAIVNASRTVQAGANVIVHEHEMPVKVGNDIALASFPVHFVTVDPAVFAEVSDDADTPETDRPVYVAEVVRGGRSLGVRFKVTRREAKDRGENQVADEVLAAIIAGVAQAADKVLLDAILAANPEAFTLAKAAASGLRIADIRAMVGTAAAGAEFRADGQLVAAGVPAELTPGIAATVVGAFDRAAVVLGPEMTIIADRLNVRGDLSVQAWLNIDAAVPDVSKFWTVEA